MIENEQQLAETIRVPAEVFPPGVFLKEELDARGWTVSRLASQMSGDPTVNEWSIKILLSVSDKGIPLDKELSANLGQAFGVHEDLFFNLDRLWQKS